MDDKVARENKNKPNHDCKNQAFDIHHPTLTTCRRGDERGITFLRKARSYFAGTARRLHRAAFGGEPVYSCESQSDAWPKKMGVKGWMDMFDLGNHVILVANL